MNRSGKILLCLTCATAFSAIARADDPVKPNKPFLHKFHPVAPPGMPGTYQPNAAAAAKPAESSAPASNILPNTPYNSIAARNVFGLNPIPVAAPVDPTAGNPPPKITLTGITTIFGPREALYKVAGYTRPGQSPIPDQSYILEEGQSQDDITVKTVDVQKGMVTFLNHGAPQDILLAAGVASGGAASSGAAPPNYAGFAGRAGGFNNNMPANLRQNLQQRFGSNNSGNNGYNNNNSSSFGSGGNSTTSPQSVSSVNGGYVDGVYTFGNQSGQSTPQLSADDNAALIAAQHAQMQQSGNPQAALFPPTAYDDQANQEAAGASSDSGSSGVGPGMPTLVPTKFPHR